MSPIRIAATSVPLPTIHPDEQQRDPLVALMLDVTSRLKEDGTPVTEADTAAEAAMLAVLRSRRPGDAFVGEEVGEFIGTTGRRWIADGIDGTRFFAAGAATLGTLLALEVEGAITVVQSTSAPSTAAPDNAIDASKF